MRLQVGLPLPRAGRGAAVNEVCKRPHAADYQLQTMFRLQEAVFAHSNAATFWRRVSFALASAIVVAALSLVWRSK